MYVVLRGRGGRCSHHPLDLDVDGLVPAPLVPRIPSFMPDVGHWAGFGIDLARWV
jgi:hypothetical protein